MTGRDKLKQASTVILLRPAESGAFEVLLTRRPDSMAFLGGMHVFPGGNVTKEDCSERMIRRCVGLSANQARDTLGAHLSPKLALGHWIAGVRELYEEVGILLACGEGGNRLAGIRVQTGNLAQKREALIRRALGFDSLLEAEDLYCDLAGMAYFSHWETPKESPIRFDTRFFLARLPEGQNPSPNFQEVADSVWVTPDRALKLFDRRELPMIFPTFASLRTLANFDTIESLFKEYHPRTA